MRTLYNLTIITFCTTLIFLSGCSGENKEQALSKELKAQMEQSIDAFDKRVIHKVLTEQTIDTTKDENLLQTIFDNLNEKLPRDPDNVYQTVMTWNRSRQAIYLIWWLEAEVNNGGFNQYYHNTNGKAYKHLPDALKLVGTTKFASLTQKANDIYEKQNNQGDLTKEAFSKSYENNPLNKLDDEFYNLYKEENLGELMVKFIRKNKKEFTDN